MDFFKKYNLNPDLYYDFEILRNLSDEYILSFQKNLDCHPDRKNEFIIDFKEKIIIHILIQLPLSELNDLTDEQKTYYPICSKQEIKKIFDVKSADDFLLRHRAEHVLNNPRLRRVFTSILKKTENWNFSKFFQDRQFEIYYSSLPLKEKKTLANVPYGSIYLKAANGYCMKTEFGNVIVVSYSLRYFLYYMNLYSFGLNYELEASDLNNSLILAIRIMLESESPDFLIDSRGNIEDNFHKEIEEFTDLQMRFIMGHEFAHHYLGHLSKSNIVEYQCIDNGKSSSQSFYSYSEQLELEADYHSVMQPILSKEDRDNLAQAAFMFFLYLNILEGVTEYINPSSSLEIKTHPKALDRLKELRSKVGQGIGGSEEDLKIGIEFSEEHRRYLINEYLPFHIETLERYGSVYLPSYKKEIIHDRLL